MTQSQLLIYLGKQAFENMVSKGENAGFLLFPQYFLSFQAQISIF